jgi:hypothetical protein
MIIKKTATLCIVLTMSALSGCAQKTSIDESIEASTESAPAAPKEEIAHGQPASLPPGVQTVTGTVVETMNAASYTYVRVESGDGEIWAAAGQFKVAVGDRVTVPLETPMQGFHSDTLDRDFELIYFASRILSEDEAAAQAVPAGHIPASHGAPAARPMAENSAVTPAEGGVTIAQVWADRSNLAGKQVKVRGRVVKFNAGIMGRNWFHIQDGSGDEAQGTHDLTITTNESVSVGPVLTVTGTVEVDQDFGFGYTYAVMVTDATVTPE